MQLQVRHARLLHNKFTPGEGVMATGSAGYVHCCLSEAAVDAKQRRSVATTINLLKDTVVDIYGEDIAVFNRDSKLCRRCHRKLIATAKLKADLTEMMKELRKQIERAGERAGVQLRQASRSSIFPGEGS